MNRTITGVDDYGHPATVTIAVDEPAPTPTMLVGATVDPDLYSIRTWPGSRFCRIFGYPGEGIPSWTQRQYRTRAGTDNRLQRLGVAMPDAIPNVVWRDWPSDTDVAHMVQAWGAQLPPEPDQPDPAPAAYLTWCHEPGPKGVDPVLYRRRWMTLAGIISDQPWAHRVKPLPTDSLQWVMGSDPAKGRGDLSIYHTGVGWPGMDCYADSWKPTYPDPKVFLTPALRVAAAAGQPPALPELGAALVGGDAKPGPDRGKRRADWIRSVVQILRAEGCALVGWWDALGTGGTDLRLDDEPSRTAWQDAVAGRI